MISYKKRKTVMKCLYDMFYQENKVDVNLEIVSAKTKISMNELMKISINLEAQGLLNYRKLDKNYSITKKENNHTVIKTKDAPSAIVSLTNSGKCYFETRRDRMFDFFRKSIIVPIVISAATTILTNLITDWLPEILKWVQLHLNF